MELSFLREQVYYGEEAQPTKQPLPDTKLFSRVPCHDSFDFTALCSQNRSIEGNSSQ